TACSSCGVAYSVPSRSTKPPISSWLWPLTVTSRYRARSSAAAAGTTASHPAAASTAPDLRAAVQGDRDIDPALVTAAAQRDLPGPVQPAQRDPPALLLAGQDIAAEGRAGRTATGGDGQPVELG